MADCGFDISDSVGLMCAEIKIPGFTQGKQQLSSCIVLLRDKFTVLTGVLSIGYLQSETNEFHLLIK